jgi:hypothetical protein
VTERPLVPHFSVKAVDGEFCRYEEIWQRKNLLLVLLPRAESADRAAYILTLTSHMADLTANDTSAVMTTDEVTGVTGPAVVIADRWGEIAFIREGKSVADLPDVDTIVDWLRHVQNRCPECEGEAR